MTLPLPKVSVDWPVRCSQFNHGWLRNRFCQSLKAEIQVVAGKVGRDCHEDAHLKWMEDWLVHEETARILIADFVNEMSPAALFNHYPLVNLDPKDALFFREMAHSHWLDRHHLKTMLAETTNALALASVRVRKLRDAKDAQDAVQSGLVASIHDACLRLADALSQLPRSILL